MESHLSMPAEPESLEETPQEFLENEVGRMFGPAGQFIVKKQIEMYNGGRPLTEADLPEIINKIAGVIGPLLGEKLTKEFKQNAKRHFGIPI